MQNTKKVIVVFVPYFLHQNHWFKDLTITKLLKATNDNSANNREADKNLDQPLSTSVQVIEFDMYKVTVDRRHLPYSQTDHFFPAYGFEYFFDFIEF